MVQYNGQTLQNGPPAPQHRSFPVESSAAALFGSAQKHVTLALWRDPRTFLQNFDGSVWVQMLYIPKEWLLAAKDN